MRSLRTRSIISLTATLALAAAAMTPSAAYGRGPGAGAGDCDGDHATPQAQAQQHARDQTLTGTQQRIRARDGSGAQVASGTATLAADGGGRFAHGQGGQAASGNGIGRGRTGNDPNDEGERGPGTCEDCSVEMGELTDEQAAGLVFMANEEKLAHDVYAVFADLYGTRIFANIAESEARHQVAVNTVLVRYGLDDPAFGLPAGKFSDTRFDELYADLVAQGSSSLEDALAVGVTIEELDIADLGERMAGLEATAPDAFEMYSNLLAASNNHLAAFQGWL